MTWIGYANYRQVWLVDFEFSAPDGERPTVVCLVARELFSNRLIRLFANELTDRPPFPVDEKTLFVAYFASAEIGCFLALGWPVPVRILDLWTEQRTRTNGTRARCGLLDTLHFYGLDSIAAVEKTELRELAMRGGPYSEMECVALLDYCQTDVDALAKLLPTMLPQIDLPRALLRGRYMAAVARMEHCGIPIDAEMLGFVSRKLGCDQRSVDCRCRCRLWRFRWPDIQARSVCQVVSTEPHPLAAHTRWPTGDRWRNFPTTGPQIPAGFRAAGTPPFAFGNEAGKTFSRLRWSQSVFAFPV